MANHNKRTLWSVQDVASGRANVSSTTRATFKSGYNGPKKSTSAVMDKYNSAHKNEMYSGSRQDQTGRKKGNLSRGRQGAYEGKRADNIYSGIFSYAWIMYCLILMVCVCITLVVYNNKSGKVEGYRYPSYVFTLNGVLNSIYNDYASGGLGSGYQQDAAESGIADSSSLLGDNVVDSTLPNTTTGATMGLDTGSTYKDYGIALSYGEMLEQLGKALVENDFGYVGMKLAYEDDTTRSLIGYPQSVVEHFVQYMSDNPVKRDLFLDEIKDENKYMEKNGSAFLVKLPILQFTINMGYDNTNVSVSGFSDLKMDAGQSAVVSPLLPCMYEITVTTDEGSQSSEVECDMGEGNLQVNIGVTN